MQALFSPHLPQSTIPQKQGFISNSFSQACFITLLPLLFNLFLGLCTEPQQAMQPNNLHMECRNNKQINKDGFRTSNGHKVLARIKRTLLILTSCFHTMSILVGLELDSGEQVIFSLFQPVGGRFLNFFFKLQSRWRNGNIRNLTFCTHSCLHNHMVLY